MGETKKIDIANNLKIVEWLKAELLDSVAVLYKSLLKTSNDMKGDALARIIIIAYLLGRRVGVPFEITDMQVKNKLGNSIDESEKLGQWQGDLSDLLQYLEKRKR